MSYFEIAPMDRVKGVEVFGRARDLLLCDSPDKLKKREQIRSAPGKHTQKWPLLYWPIVKVYADTNNQNRRKRDSQEWSQSPI